MGVFHRPDATAPSHDVEVVWATCDKGHISRVPTLTLGQSGYCLACDKRDLPRCPTWERLEWYYEMKEE